MLSCRANKFATSSTALSICMQSSEGPSEADRQAADRQAAIRRDLIVACFALFGAPLTYISYVKTSLALPLTLPRLFLIAYIICHVVYTWAYAFKTLRRGAATAAVMKEKPWVLLNLTLLTISGPIVPIALFLAPLGGDSPDAYQRPSFFFMRSIFFSTTTLCTGLHLATSSRYEPPASGRLCISNQGSTSLTWN